MSKILNSSLDGDLRLRAFSINEKIMYVDKNITIKDIISKKMELSLFKEFKYSLSIISSE